MQALSRGPYAALLGLSLLVGCLPTGSRDGEGLGGQAEAGPGEAGVDRDGGGVGGAGGGAGGAGGGVGGAGGGACVPDCEGRVCGPDRCGGECGVCTGGTLCLGGQCVQSECPAGQLDCGAGCVSVLADPARCGRCDRICPDAPGLVADCVAGDCFVTCPELAGQGISVDLAADPEHCGACGNRCGPPAGGGPPACVDGGCLGCAEGTVETQACGLNGRGQATRTCTEGRFEAFGACADPDACVDEAVGVRACGGLNGRAEEQRRCAAGQWGPYGACVDPDACVNDGVERRPCGGLNGRAEEARRCRGGQWGEFGACVDPDECVDEDRRVRPCGQAGFEPQGCREGRWRSLGPCEAGGTACAGEAQPPCNGCPVHTVVPAGFVCVPAGTFLRGSPENEPGRFLGDHEQRHEVELTRPYFIQATEITQGEFRQLMGRQPSFHSGCGEECPAERLTFADVIDYANQRSARSNLPACLRSDGRGAAAGAPLECRGYRLPTEAEWERACRAGTQTAYSWGAVADVAYAVYGGLLGFLPEPVGRRRPNAFGIYDMSGNVSEWTFDRFGLYGAAPLVDPVGPAEGVRRTTRGGDYNSPPEWIRCAFRAEADLEARSAFLGGRLARTAP